MTFHGCKNFCKRQNNWILTAISAQFCEMAKHHRQRIMLRRAASSKIATTATHTTTNTTRSMRPNCCGIGSQRPGAIHQGPVTQERKDPIDPRLGVLKPKMIRGPNLAPKVQHGRRPNSRLKTALKWKEFGIVKTTTKFCKSAKRSSPKRCSRKNIGHWL